MKGKKKKDSQVRKQHKNERNQNWIDWFKEVEGRIEGKGEGGRSKEEE